MYTLQETFDHIVTALNTQGRPSQGNKPGIPDFTICLYRGPNGLKCAAGHCIPDEEYSPEMEGESIHRSSAREVILRNHNLALVIDLQTCHDTACIGSDSDEKWLTEFNNRAVSVAEKYNLTLKEPLK